MPELNGLQKRIRERQRFIERVDKLMRKVVVGFGEQTHYSQGSSHTHTVWELNGFAGFSFVGDYGQSMMGGNDIHISYRGQKVLHVSYAASADECEVELFADGQWVAAMTKLFKTYKQVLKWRLDKKAAEKKKKEAERAKMSDEQKLAGDAKRLGLTAEAPPN